MGEICSSSPAIVPRFVYATESYLGTPQELLQQYGLSNASYQCCSCEGDCATNPNCQCIMRCDDMLPNIDGYNAYLISDIVEMDSVILTPPTVASISARGKYSNVGHIALATNRNAPCD